MITNNLLPIDLKRFRDVMRPHRNFKNKTVMVNYKQLIDMVVAINRVAVTHQELLHDLKKYIILMSCMRNDKEWNKLSEEDRERYAKAGMALIMNNKKYLRTVKP